VSPEDLAQLKRQLVQLVQTLAEGTAEREALRAENERLRREVEAWRRGLRERGKGRSSRPEKKRATERDLRDDARHRAMTGGTRSRQGSEVLAHGRSITPTRRKNGRALGPFVHGVIQAHLSGKPPPSVFAD
jgi:hypothetical protein